MDPKQTLDTLMSQETLTPNEAREGVVACFVVINRAFIQRRMGERPINEIDSVTRSLINQVFDEIKISKSEPTLGELNHAWKILNVQFGFEAEPDLAKQHDQVISSLLGRMERGQTGSG